MNRSRLGHPIRFQYLMVVGALMALILPSIAVAQSRLIGTYNVNYRYNAAGPPPGSPNAGNPYYGPSPIPPGPYFINATPGRYRVVVTGYGSRGPSSGYIWSGDAASGTLMTGPAPGKVGDSIEFEHTHGQIVLFYWDWYVWDNDPNISVQLALYSVPENVVTVTNSGDSSPGTLRDAINFANGHPGTTIQFNIPYTDPGYQGGVFIIKPASPLPAIQANGTIVDGYSQTAFAGNTNGNGPEVELNGTNAGNGAIGLRIFATNCQVQGLVVDAFSDTGIQIGDGNTTANNNAVSACYVGLEPGGQSARGNGSAGILINAGSQANRIDSSVISGNGSHGIVIYLADNNIIRDNKIGTDSQGRFAVPNAVAGVVINGSRGNMIGQTAPLPGNLISGNGRYGVYMDNSASLNLVQNNLIGCDLSGAYPVPNQLTGITLTDFSHNNTIGGLTAGARNVVSGNGDDGIDLGDQETSADSNLIEGNYIGTTANGQAACPNRSSGIFIVGTGNMVGGTAAGAGNLLSGNVGHGLVLWGPVTNANRVLGNLIGTAADANSALGNSGAGIVMSGGAQNNIVGAVTSHAANSIAFNGGIGVDIHDSGTTGNMIRGNSIFNNGGLGIDLGEDGITANDPLDADQGPNHLQNFPIITQVTTSGNQTVVRGTLSSLPNTSFAIDVYGNTVVDPIGYGEGQTYLQSITVKTDVHGNASWSVSVLKTTLFFSTTATNTTTGDTSEFSRIR